MGIHSLIPFILASQKCGQHFGSHLSGQFSHLSGQYFQGFSQTFPPNDPTLLFFLWLRFQRLWGFESFLRQNKRSTLMFHGLLKQLLDEKIGWCDFKGMAKHNKNTSIAASQKTHVWELDVFMLCWFHVFTCTSELKVRHFIVSHLFQYLCKLWLLLVCLIFTRDHVWSWISHFCILCFVQQVCPYPYILCKRRVCHLPPDFIMTQFLNVLNLYRLIAAHPLLLQ